MDEKLIVYVILGATLVLFIWNRIRYDVVALLALAALILTGLVSEKEAFLGLAEPAVLTVAAVLILSHSLTKAGLSELMARSLGWTQNNPSLQVFVLCLVVGIYQ